MLELYYNFFDQFCDNVNTQTSIFSIYLPLVEENLDECTLPSKRAEWKEKPNRDCRDSLRADSKNSFFPLTCCSKHKKHDKRKPGLFKEEFRCTERLYLWSKTYRCYDSNSQWYKFISKGLNKRVLEDSTDGPMAKNRHVQDEAVNLKLTNRGFKTIIYLVATYELKKGLSYFYPKCEVECDEIHTKPLKL